MGVEPCYEEIGWRVEEALEESWRCCTEDVAFGNRRHRKSKAQEGGIPGVLWFRLALPNILGLCV